MDQYVISTIFHFMTVTSLGYLRIAPIFFLLPFLNTGSLPSVVRMPAIAFLSFTLVPVPENALKDLNEVMLVLVIFKEVIIGLSLGCILSFPFWVYHAIGSFIDNQRGATLSSTLDPTSGVDTSELAKFLNMLSVVIYLEQDGLLHLVRAIYSSYILNPVFEYKLPDLLYFLGYLTNLMSSTIMISSPVIAVMLGSEVFLGVLSRYASQLNAFSVSMTIKSGLAFLIMIIYYYPVLVNKVIVLTPSIDFIDLYFQGVR